MRLLLVEDDGMIGRGLLATFKKTGVVVDWVRTGADAHNAVMSNDHAMVILDIGLPDISGLDVLAELRSKGRGVPVLLLTARAAVDDRVKGLDLGADDYLAKPFAVPELLARVRALSRRKSGGMQSLLAAGEVSLDLASQEVSYRGEKMLLPSREFALMRVLVETPGTILSRAQIEDRIYGWNTEIESNAVAVLIHSLRRKFDKDIIRNVRGAGWMISKGDR